MHLRHEEEREASPHSVLGSLRALIPAHDRVTFAEALQVAERQADKLLHLHGHAKLPIPTELITALPKVAVEYTRHLASGATFWHHHRQTWIIHLSRSDSPRRQRFTLAHEYKHIIDHGRFHLLYEDSDTTTTKAQSERAADYFAGCLLVPRHLLTRAWDNGVRKTHKLAQLFYVSEQAIVVRLKQCALIDRRNPAQPLGHVGVKYYSGSNSEEISA